MLCDSIFKADQPLEDKSTLIIFDTSWVANAAATAKFYSSIYWNDKFTGHIFGFMAKVLSAFKAYGKGDIEDTALIFTYDNYPEEIYKIFPEYKAGRDKTRFNPIPDVKNLVSLFNCFQASNIKTEADDVIGSLAVDFCSSHKIYIISADKDLWQLLDYHPNINITPRLKEKITLQIFEKKFGIKYPKGLALYKAIFGDPSDAIKKLQGRLSRKPIYRYIDRSDGSPINFYKLLEVQPKDMDVGTYKILVDNREYVEKMYSITKLNIKSNYTLDNKVSYNKIEELLKYLHSFGIKKFDKDVKSLY